MPTMTFRNRLGNLIDIQTITASEVKNRFGTALDHATRGGAVAITKHDSTKAMLISIEEFESLVASRHASLTSLSVEFDALLEQMQTPAHRKGAQRAFAASPAQTGRIAPIAATRGRKKQQA